MHSLHAYFLRPGDPTLPILYLVDRIRDGRSFATRRVTAIQHGEAIFTLSASFHCAETGVEHQQAMPAAPDPLTLPTFAERWAPHAGRLGDWYTRPRPIDTRTASVFRAGITGPSAEPTLQTWFRSDGPLPDDPLLHACVVAYASDMSLLDTIVGHHGLNWDDGSLMGASLDHAMWFHRPFRADQWLLYDQESTVATGGRGVGRGEIYTAGGVLVVSVVQEGLIRSVVKR